MPYANKICNFTTCLHLIMFNLYTHQYTLRKQILDLEPILVFDYVSIIVHGQLWHILKIKGTNNPL
jgi:hypothetical protein